MGSISASLARTIAFSALPPMPMPSMPGGHQPAPMVGTVFNTQSTMLSEGLSMVNLDLFSEPPPLAATVDFHGVPRHHSHVNHRRVLSRVFLRAPAGSATMEARSMLSGSR